MGSGIVEVLDAGMLALAGCNCNEDCEATAGLAVWASTEAVCRLRRQPAAANRRQTIPVMMRAEDKRKRSLQGENSPTVR